MRFRNDIFSSLNCFLFLFFFFLISFRILGVENSAIHLQRTNTHFQYLWIHNCPVCSPLIRSSCKESSKLEFGSITCFKIFDIIKLLHIFEFQRLFCGANIKTVSYFQPTQLWNYRIALKCVFYIIFLKKIRKNFKTNHTQKFPTELKLWKFCCSF